MNYETVAAYIETNLGIDDRETIEMLLDNYLESATENIALANNALAAGNMEELRRAGHTIKGCSANIGLEPLRTAGKELEDAAKANDRIGGREKIDCLTALVKELSGNLGK